VPIEQPPSVAPQQLPPQPQVTIEQPPQVSPAPAPEVPIARPRPTKRAVARVRHPAPAKAPAAAAEDQADSTPAETAEQQPAKPAKAPLKLWPATQSQGAEGRIVRIGAFGSRDQAKLGWRYMVRAYPAVAHLPATVVGVRNSHGQHFYRFQIGTTSQAHSEVLCQRMDRIHFSCAVVGLPWKPKGVER
jgi:outer membrane biosynthesis protein TonB